MIQLSSLHSVKHWIKRKESKPWRVNRIDSFNVSYHGGSSIVVKQLKSIFLVYIIKWNFFSYWINIIHFALGCLFLYFFSSSCRRALCTFTFFDLARPVCAYDRVLFIVIIPRQLRYSVWRIGVPKQLLTLLACLK